MLDKLPPEQIMPADHKCQCRLCHPERFPGIPEQWGAHYLTVYNYARIVGARAFTRHVSGCCIFDELPCYQYHLECDGKMLTWPSRPRGPDDLAIIEAMAGLFGWYIIDQHWSYGRRWWPHDCACGSKIPCSIAIYGHIRFWRNNWQTVYDGADKIEFDTPQVPML